MFAKRLLQKAVNHHHHHSQQGLQQQSVTSADLDLRVVVHYGIPSTASILAFDPIQRLLAIGTLDGRIKVIGGDGIEGLLMSPKKLPYKYIEFLHNQGFLVSILNDNDIQVWNLEGRCLVCSLQWESNITAFSVIHGSSLMYVGDEYALLAVVKYNAEEGKLVQLPYHLSADSVSEAAEFPFPTDQPIVGLLLQPGSSGNRVLIAYQNGLLILWDVSEARIVFLGGGKDLQLKDGVIKPTDEVNIDSPENTIEHQLGEKEISALCWASSNGSILAVGYVDGDILFWNTSSAASINSQPALSSSNNVVKLRLSSAERRLPVIVLQWSTLNKSHNDSDGQLFIYGGDEIGSDEVLTVLTLDWSSGMGNLRCIGRTDLALTGSFADMVLLPNSATMAGSHRADVFVLTNPGQLHFYDETSLSALINQQEKKPSVSALEFPVVIPAANPAMTASKLIRTAIGENSLKSLSEISSVVNLSSLPSSLDGTKCPTPLTGGVPSQLFLLKNSAIERVYLAGYSDGSVRIWNATYPLLSFICVFEGEVQGIKVTGLSSPVSRIDFCIFTLNLAVGSESGLVRIYNLKGCPDGTGLLFVTETECEAHSLSQGKGPQCRAVFSLANSRVQTLQFVKRGCRLAVGFECGHVAVLDTCSLSILFFIKDISSSPVISMTWKEITNPQGLLKSSKLSETKSMVQPIEEVMLILTKDATIYLICGNTGNLIIPRPWQLKKELIAISMCVIDGKFSVPKVSDTNPPEEHSKDSSTKNEPMAESSPVPIDSLEVDLDYSAYSEERFLNSLILLCCVDSVRLYSTKSVIQGNNEPIQKVKHARPCIWTATLKKAENVWALTLLFQTGEIEIRSIPDLALVKESSLMSILRWNCKENMDKTMSSDDAHITVANGHETVIVSMLAAENDFRIPESLPSLHDAVLAAAADAALSVYSNQKKKQTTAPAILGGIVKGLKGGKMVKSGDSLSTPKSRFDHLEGMFWKSQQSDSLPGLDHQENLELNIGLVLI